MKYYFYIAELQRNMSHETYTKVWTQAQEFLDDATRIDVDQQSAKPLKDKRLAHK